MITTICNTWAGKPMELVHLRVAADETIEVLVEEGWCAPYWTSDHSIPSSQRRAICKIAAQGHTGFVWLAGHEVRDLHERITARWLAGKPLQPNEMKIIAAWLGPELPGFGGTAHDGSFGALS